MKQSAECATLILDNKICYAGPTTIDSTYRINFRDLLGDMYNKYPKFKLMLNNSMWSGQTLTGGTNVCAIRMTGLNWANSSYGNNPINLPVTLTNNSGVQMSSNSADANYPTFITLPINANVYVHQYPPSEGLVFNRPTSDTTDLRVTFTDIRQNKNPTYAAGTIVYMMAFSIYGLYDD